MRAVLAPVALLLWFLAGCQSAPSGVPDTAPPELSQARKLYKSKCSRCHKLYDPRKYDDEGWALWMQKMAKKAKLKPEQREAIARYVESAIRHPAPP